MYCVANVHPREDNPIICGSSTPRPLWHHPHSTHMWWCYLLSYPRRGKRSTDYPAHRVSHITFPPPWNGGIFGTYRLTGLRIRSYVPTQTSIHILGTQGDMFIIRRTRKHFFKKKCSKWDSNSCPQRCQMWWYYLLSYRGKRSNVMVLPTELPG